MQPYEKLRPLLEEYNRLSDEWRALEPPLAGHDFARNFRHRMLEERRKELQAQILQLTQSDRRLIN